MLVLLLLAILLVALTVWMLMRGITRPINDDEASARLAQYSLQRDRLLNELDRVETAKQSGDIEADAAEAEIARLELELASILKRLESSEADQQLTAVPRHVSFITAAMLALVLPLVAGVAYVSVQGEELLWLAGFDKRGSDAMPMNHPRTPQTAAAPSAQQFPPEVMQMVARLEKRLQDNPDDGEGWKRLGRSYQVLGRNRDAITAYSRAAELLPNDNDVNFALQQLSGSASSPPPQQQANSQFPPQVMEMVAQLEKRLQQNPNDGEGWKRLGRSYMVLGRNRDAVAAYSQAAELLADDKDVRLALQQLAALASSGKHPQQAGKGNQVAHPPMPEGSLERVIAYEKQVATEPDNALAWADLAFAYEEIGRGEDAERAWAKAYELAPDNADILAAYAGNVFTNNPRDPQGKALKLYRKLYELNPKHPDGLWFLGLAAYSEGNIARTRELWRELLTVLPEQSEAYASVSEALAGVERLLKSSK
jgi:cytochrome c-type biogenesis protein CcmH/NrfG